MRERNQFWPGGSLTKRWGAILVHTQQNALSDEPDSVFSFLAFRNATDRQRVSGGSRVRALVEKHILSRLLANHKIVNGKPCIHNYTDGWVLLQEGSTLFLETRDESDLDRE